MAYTDPKPMSQSRMTSIVLVIAIHVAAIYAMLTGGAEYVKKKLTDLEVIEIEKEPPPPPEKLPPPPPPDTKLPPPPVVPPPLVQVNTPTPAPVIVQTPTPPPVYVPPAPAPVITPPAPPPAVALSPRGDPGSWFSPDDIPDSIKRSRDPGVIGVTRFSLDIGPNGRVTSCSVTSSSGEATLDALTCRLATSRARFKPGKDSAGNDTGGTFSRSVRWQIAND